MQYYALTCVLTYHTVYLFISKYIVSITRQFATRWEVDLGARFADVAYHSSLQFNSFCQSSTAVNYHKEITKIRCDEILGTVNLGGNKQLTALSQLPDIGNRG